MREEHITREAQARQEIGETSFSPGVAMFLTLFFGALLLAVWLLQLVDDRRNAASAGRGMEPLLATCGIASLVPSVEETGFVLKGGDLPSSLSSLAAVRAGRSDGGAGFVSRFQLVNARVLASIDAFDGCLNESGFLADQVVPWVRGVTVGLLQAGNGNALVGRDGWLFFKPGLDHLMGAPFLDPDVMKRRRQGGNEWTATVSPDPVAAILELNAALGERDIALVVMPAPVKPMIYPDRLSARYGVPKAPIVNPSRNEWTKRLAAAGVRVFDPAVALLDARAAGGDPVYLETDTHWSPRGVEVAAAALRTFLADEGLVTPSPSNGPFVRQPAPVTNLGDVGVMLNVAAPVRRHQPETVTVDRVLTKQGRPWSPDRGAPVLLLGDSFTNIYSLEGMGWGAHAGLAEQLSFELGTPVDVIAANDSGAFATRKILSQQLAGGRDRLAGKSVVIYQFAARELSNGDWKTGLPMTVGAKAASTARADGAVRVRGTVEAVVRSPAPGSVAYKDCFIPVHLTGVTAEEGAFDGTEGIVFVWGMLDGKLTSYNRLKVGETVTLPVVPFRTVADTVGAYRHEELTDPRLLSLPVFWGETRMPGKGTASGPATPAETTPGASDLVSERDRDGETGPVRRFLDGAEMIYRKALADGATVIEGVDGWLFLPSEVRHLASGPFWGPHADAVSRAVKPGNRDPLPAILDFHRQLRSAGVALLVVPVPAKAVVYPDKMVPPPVGSSTEAIPRLDAYRQRFIDMLDAEGVAVLDLTGEFLAARQQGALYCLQDSHWSGLAIKLAAAAIAARIGDPPWRRDLPRGRFDIERTEVTFAGDLWSRLGQPDRPRASQRLFFVKGRGDASAEPWRESPVLLLGDSHTLVFHAGDDMHAKGAGLSDHLAAALGFPVDLVGVRGSGATPSRVSLMRRGDNLAGKKVVVWVFASREFTESRTGWAKVPVVR